MFTLTNPLGLLALLGIPAVLAIHFLQRKAAELPVSTLFLLERTQRDAASGRRLDRLVPSIPLWMQLLAVLLLAWFLAEPRYQKPGSVRRVAVVLDSSASMGVFKEQALARLAAALPALQGAAAALELTVLESVPSRPRHYAGSSVADLRTALASWKPRDGLVDPSQSLRLARSLVSREGAVLYLTDTPVDALPFDARLLAAGEKIDNVGFTGVTFTSEQGTPVWRALVRNYGDRAVERTWSLLTSSGGTAPRTIRMEPRSLVTLQAAFPADAKNVRLVLSADRFPLDDVLPMVMPAPKPLAVFATGSPAFTDLTAKLLRALDAAIPARDAATADLSLAGYDPLDPVLPQGNSVIFVEDGTRAGAWLKGGIIAEPHPLLDGLNWQSLLARETIQLDRMPSDKVLLWQEKRPLIFLREGPDSRRLCFNFDLRHSNAANQPALIVLLHRFAASIREAKVAPYSTNLETGQPLQVATAPGLPVKSSAFDPEGKPLPPPPPGTAPPDPGFLTIGQDGALLLNAAVSFADTREADFSACGTSDPPADSGTGGLRNHTRADPLWRLWILLLLAILMISWKFTSRRSTPIQNPNPIPNP